MGARDKGPISNIITFNNFMHNFFKGFWVHKYCFRRLYIFLYENTTNGKYKLYYIYRQTFQETFTHIKKVYTVGENNICAPKMP